MTKNFYPSEQKHMNVSSNRKRDCQNLLSPDLYHFRQFLLGFSNTHLLSNAVCAQVFTPGNYFLASCYESLLLEAITCSFTLLFKNIPLFE